MPFQTFIFDPALHALFLLKDMLNFMSKVRNIQFSLCFAKFIMMLNSDCIEYFYFATDFNFHNYLFIVSVYESVL